jgi:hypothetical protein
MMRAHATTAQPNTSSCCYSYNTAKTEGSSVTSLPAQLEQLRPPVRALLTSLRSCVKTL